MVWLNGITATVATRSAASVMARSPAPGGQSTTTTSNAAATAGSSRSSFEVGNPITFTRSPSPSASRAPGQQRTLRVVVGATARNGRPPQRAPPHQTVGAT